MCRYAKRGSMSMPQRGFWSGWNPSGGEVRARCPHQNTRPMPPGVRYLGMPVNELPYVDVFFSTTKKNTAPARATFPHEPLSSEDGTLPRDILILNLLYRVFCDWTMVPSRLHVIRLPPLTIRSLGKTRQCHWQSDQSYQVPLTIRSKPSSVIVNQVFRLVIDNQIIRLVSDNQIMCHHQKNWSN